MKYLEFIKLMHLRRCNIVRKCSFFVSFNFWTFNRTLWSKRLNV